MKKRYITLIICLLITYCLIFFFNTIKTEITQTVHIWISIIVPSVFPYITLSKYLCQSDALRIFEIFPGKLIIKLFNISRCSTNAVFCSLFCGYPSGAVCAMDLYQKRMISIEETARLIAFTNNAGPLFVISAIGSGLMGSTGKGVAIYIIHIISAFTYGFIISFGEKNRNTASPKNISYSPDLCYCIKSAVETTINICGFMISACVLSECSKILITYVIPADEIKYSTLLINGLFEISSGVKTVAESNLNSIKFPLICAITSWSGLSVIMQIKSVAGKVINTTDILKAKLIQSLISFALGFIFEYITIKNTVHIYSSDTGFKISAVFSIVLFIYYITRKKGKKAR